MSLTREGRETPRGEAVDSRGRLSLTARVEGPRQAIVLDRRGPVRLYADLQAARTLELMMKV